MTKKKLTAYDRIEVSDLLEKEKLKQKWAKKTAKRENLRGKGPERGDRIKGPNGGRRVEKGLSREERGEFREIEIKK